MHKHVTMKKYKKRVAQLERKHLEPSFSAQQKFLVASTVKNPVLIPTENNFNPSSFPPVFTAIDG